MCCGHWRYQELPPDLDFKQLSDPNNKKLPKQYESTAVIKQIKQQSMILYWQLGHNYVL